MKGYVLLEDAKADRERRVDAEDDFISSGDFVRSFVPPDYLVEGLFIRGFLYALTAPTGHGKTAVLLHLAQQVAQGGWFGPHKIEQGSVLYLAGENPDDITMRWMTQAHCCGFDPETIPVTFIRGVKSIEENLEKWKKRSERVPNLSLVVADTATAYYPGDDPNNNAQQGAFARLLRRVTEFHGHPAVVAACHPIKNALSDQLVPQGGGNFLNEVDGNLGLWADGDRLKTTLSIQRKFRGPEFDPITFRLDIVKDTPVRDSKGRALASVVARPMSATDMASHDAQALTDENILMGVINLHPKATLEEMARSANWFTKPGTPAISKVLRLCRALKDEGFLEQKRKKWTLTKKGRREVGEPD